MIQAGYEEIETVCGYCIGSEMAGLHSWEVAKNVDGKGFTICYR